MVEEILLMSAWASALTCEEDLISSNGSQSSCLALLTPLIKGNTRPLVHFKVFLERNYITKIYAEDIINFLFPRFSKAVSLKVP